MLVLSIGEFRPPIMAYNAAGILLYNIILENIFKNIENKIVTQ